MSQLPKIVYADIDADAVEIMAGELQNRIEAVGHFSWHLEGDISDDEFCDRVGDATALFLGWKLPDAVLERCKNLEVIVFTGTGAANYVNLPLASERGIAVCNTPGYADQTVAEHAIALMLAVARKIVLLDRQTRAGRWNQDLPAFDLQGKTLGLLGLGGIGACTAKLAQAFGMEVIVHTANPSLERAAACGVRFESLKKVMSHSDIVSIHLPLNAKTEGLVSREHLALMRDNAVLINTARAEIVDRKGLLAELQSGRISAGLDVFDQEPLDKKDPLLALDNVVITPHTGYNTPEANRALMEIAVGSLEAWFAGKPINQVNA